MGKNLNKHNQVVIRETKKKNVKFFVVVLAFIASGVFLLNIESFYETRVALLYQITGIVILVFFSVCGLVVLLTIRQPKLVISDEGVLIPHLFGKSFVHWDDVDKIEIIEQITAPIKLKYIGIFAVDPNAVGNSKPDAMTQFLLLRNRLPTWVIEFADSPEQIEEVMGVLEEFHNEYKNKHDSRELS